jgi:hypothetical protein
MLTPRKVYRMSGPVVAIGFILLIPSILGMLFAIMLGASVNNDIAAGVALVFGVASFVGGLLGWLLVMKRRVLQCSVCGAVVNAS